MNGNILVVGDTHIPFELPGYLDFCLDVKKRVKCSVVVHVGDLVDNHAISFHDLDPDGKSPSDEMAEADKHLKNWFKAFPNLYLCRGNHDELVDRKSKHVGLPSRVFRQFRNIWNLPNGWIDGFNFEIQGVRFQHGTGYSGENAHLIAASNNRQSTIIGHTHASSAVAYQANEKDCIFGMNVGCGIDRHAYAFAYGKDFKKKPIISCGVVTDNGKFAQVFPMDL